MNQLDAQADYVRRLHATLWAIPPGPEHAEQRDTLRRRWWTAYNDLRRRLAE